jgi:hypothetical protein
MTRLIFGTYKIYKCSLAWSEGKSKADAATKVVELKGYDSLGKWRGEP